MYSCQLWIKNMMSCVIADEKKCYALFFGLVYSGYSISSLGITIYTEQQLQITGNSAYFGELKSFR